MIELKILMPICALLFGYLIGGIPTSIIIGKVFYKQDPREFGSHNPGGTNATRLWGKKVGFTIIAIDMFKSLLPTWVAILVFRLTDLNLESVMGNEAIMWGIWLAALGSVLGHCFSIYLKFTGGKGVSTYIGSLGTTNLFQLFVGLGTFLGTLFSKRMVSLASIVMSTIACLISWIMYFVFNTGDSSVQNIINSMFIISPSIINMTVAYPVVVTLMTVVLIGRHWQNIERIKNGTEKLIKSKKITN